MEEIGWRLPLQLQCSYQGQQGDVRQSVRGNCKTRFWGGQNLTAVEGNASVYQVNPVRRISGEGRAEKAVAREYIRSNPGLKKRPWPPAQTLLSHRRSLLAILKDNLQRYQVK